MSIALPDAFSDYPSGWRVLPLLAVVNRSDVPNTGMHETNLLSLSYGQIVRRDISTSGGLLPESFETYQVVEPGMTVFRFTDLQNDQRSLRSGFVTERGIITSAYVAVAPHGVDPKFFSYLMRAFDTSKVFYGMGGGVRQGIRYDDIRRLPVPVPPMDEQLQIADFLDRETAQIDALIGKQKQFIRLLQERLVAVTAAHFAGDQPTRALGSCLDQLLDHRGKTPKKMGGSDFTDSGVRVVSAANIKNGAVSWEERERYVPDWMFEKWMPIPLRRGDVLLTSEAPLGNLAQVPDDEPLVLSQRLFALRGRPDVLDSTYLRFFLGSHRGQQLLRDGGTGSTVSGIRQSKLVQIPIPVPPMAEQRRVAADLIEQTARIASVVAKAQELIRLARERRTALITDSVTGRLEVSSLGAA